MPPPAEKPSESMPPPPEAMPNAAQPRGAARPRSASSRQRAVAVLVALGVCWGWYVHFWPHFHAANEAIRLYFIQAVVDEGRPELDGVVARHGSVPVDRSERGGHIYMDKAPGLSLLTLPLYPVLRVARPEVAGPELWLLGYAACLLGVALPLLLALGALRRWLEATGVAPRHALATVLAIGLGSPVFVYATLYFGHGLAAACVALGVFLVAARDPEALAPRQALLAGLCLGFGGLTDTPVFILAALACLHVFARSLPADGRRADRWKTAMIRALPVVAGVAVCALAQLAYNAWVLGHPLRFTYQFKGDTELAAIMDTGFFGFRPPQADALWGLWAGARRGLLYHAPWLVLAAIGHLRAARDVGLERHRRVDAAALLAMAVAYGLLVAGFADWPAGDSAGPRHLLPIVPLLGAGLGAWLARPPASTLARALAPATVAGAVLLAVPVVATFPYHFHQIERPVLELSWPLALQGYFSPSLGRFAGISDWLSFALFLAMVALPWLLLPARPGGARVDGRRRLGESGLVLAVLLAWLTALAATVPPPDRTVSILRFQAATLLGPDAEERDGDKEWQQLLDPDDSEDPTWP